MDRLSMRRTVACVLALSLATANQLVGQSITTVSSEIACPKCTIELDTVVTLEEDTAFRIYPAMFVANDSRGRWYSANQAPIRFAVFDSTGRVVRSFGREGGGPWEYRWPLPPKVLGDSLYIQDPNQARLTVLRLDGRPVRMVSMTRVSGYIELLPNGSMIAMPVVEISSDPETPVQLLDASGRVTRKFGVDGARAGRRHEWGHAWGTRSGGVVWIASLNRYRIEAWDTTGKLLRTVVRRADWFRDWDIDSRSPPGEPKPWLERVWERDGLLWAAIRVADRQYPSNSAKIEAPHGHPRHNSKLYDTVIEIIDLKTGRLVASRRFDSVLNVAAPAGYLTGYFEDEDGIPHLPIMKVELVGYHKK